MSTHPEEVPYFDGAKIRLNVQGIRGRKGSLSTGFDRFLREHEDTVFTARDQHIGFKRLGPIYALDEDPTPGKWLFYTEDLRFAED